MEAFLSRSGDVDSCTRPNKMEQGQEVFKRPGSPVRPRPLVPSLDNVPGTSSDSPSVAPNNKQLPGRLVGNISHRSDPALLDAGLRALSRSGERLLPSPRKGSGGKPMHALPQSGSARASIYSPRWIVSVKRETDREIKEFLMSLQSPELRVKVFFFFFFLFVFFVLLLANH